MHGLDFDESSWDEMYSYTLRERYKRNVKDEEQCRTVDVVFDDFPSIVFGADLVATFAPVIVGQTGLTASVIVYSWQ